MSPTNEPPVIHLAHRVQHLAESATLALTSRTKALQRAGRSIVNFAAGEPDFDTPIHIKEAAMAAIRDGWTKYTPSSGLPELRQAVAQRVSQRTGCAYEVADVLIACGAKHALFNAFQVLCDDGDEVIIPAPYWLSYPPLVELAGGRAVILPTSQEERFVLAPERLEAAITTRTRAVVLNTPSNPTGAVYDESTLRGWAAVLARHPRVVVVSDEIYEDLVYPPAAHRSILRVAPALRDHALVVSGVSKTYAMTGWRIGYLVGPRAVIGAADRLQSHATSNPATMSQRAALAALTGDQRCVEEFRVAFQHRRDRFLAGLRNLPGIRCAVPDGAFYLFCDVRAWGMSAATCCERLLDEAGIAAIPGDTFGADDHIRFSFATSDAEIDEGLRRLTAWRERAAHPAAQER